MLFEIEKQYILWQRENMKLIQHMGCETSAALGGRGPMELYYSHG